MAESNHYCASCDTHFCLSIERHAEIEHNGGIFHGVENGDWRDYGGSL